MPFNDKCNMQKQSIDSFMRILDTAITLHMPKLLACCEYHIAVDPNLIRRFQENASHLSYRLPLSSALCIAKGLRIAHQKATQNTLSFHMPSRKTSVGWL